MTTTFLKDIFFAQIITSLHTKLRQKHDMTLNEKMSQISLTRRGDNLSYFNECLNHVLVLSGLKCTQSHFHFFAHTQEGGRLTPFLALANENEMKR
jgi:hypothetical protein